jgi:CRISPR/Cas system-associated exonuclease Cas4 (RecB family)
MSLPEDFVFSQSALQDYEDCRRRFELRYLLDVRWPALETASALEHEERMLKGQEFHHMVHQHSLGVPAETLEATVDDDELRAWWRRYLGWQGQNLPADRYPELTLTAPLAGATLMAKYDVVAKLADGQFLIVDWKTGRAQRRAALERRMQTLVYPCVLSKAGDWLNGGDPIAPERIRFVYWFAESGDTVEFALDAVKLKQYEDRLASMISDIAASFEFPKTEDERHCRFCVYRSLCERGERAGDLEEMDEDEGDLAAGITLDLDEIEEIGF